MFNSGKVLQTLGIIITIAGMLGALVGGILVISSSFLLTLLIWIGGGFFAFLIGCLVGGFGELIENSGTIAYELKRNYDREKKHEKDAAATPSVHADEWLCSCGRVNKKYVSSCACGRAKPETNN